jgi:hypothetical protein
LTMVAQILISTAERYAGSEAEREKTFRECNDKDLAHDLGIIANHVRFYEAASMHKQVDTPKETLNIGLNIVEERVRKEGLDRHPALASIVREMAALSPADLWNNAKKVAAVINATSVNPWRMLPGVPGQTSSASPKPE